MLDMLDVEQIVLVTAVAVVVLFRLAGDLRRRYHFGDREGKVSLFLAELRHQKKLDEFLLSDGIQVHSDV